MAKLNNITGALLIDATATFKWSRFSTRGRQK